MYRKRRHSRDKIRLTKIFFMANSFTEVKNSIPRKKITSVSFSSPEDQNSTDGIRNTGMIRICPVPFSKNKIKVLYSATKPINDKKQKKRLCI
jgi:hypothetical protein